MKKRTTRKLDLLKLIQCKRKKIKKCFEDRDIFANLYFFYFFFFLQVFHINNMYIEHLQNKKKKLNKKYFFRFEYGIMRRSEAILIYKHQ